MTIVEIFDYINKMPYENVWWQTLLVYGGIIILMLSLWLFLIFWVLKDH